MNDVRDEQEPTAAELFEHFFGPSIFFPWTSVLLERADPRPGERVLDLACATGIVARRVAPVVGDNGDVVGVDPNPDMLAVARQRAEADGVTIEWRESTAEGLDLPDAAFDLALCQQGLQFFDDPLSGLTQTRRVLDDGGRMVLNVWQPLHRHPLYRAIFQAEARHLDTAVEDVATPFTFGDRGRLQSLLDRAGFQGIEIEEHTLDAVFDDPETFVTLTVMAGAAVVPEFAVDDEEERSALIEAIQTDAADALEPHRDGDSIRFPMPNYIATAYA